MFAAMNDTNPSLLPSSLFNQKPLSLDKELWLFAEERAQEILCVIQPNALSEANRKEIINYVKRLIRGYYGAEVFAFGSVPLKTYLPDGDIDFTVLSHENAEEDLAQKVRSILESEEKSGHQVKDVQHIRAQVQVVKCTVKDIAVDISFNQMAGLYALRFLEQVDQFLGRNHLFKRSIILIKAWLYYESRILGSHHGLLSTYAVEILVLYIINHFHSSVDGPLEVLYRFLDYYGKFDWETNYITVDGPKALSTLPEIVETPDCDRGGFLLSKEFLKSYKDICFVQSTVPGTKTHEFPTKFMNILDPLKSNNNLGRSVSKSSLHRIKMALSYGARKLKETLTLPGECMGAAIENFFKITLDRNGKGLRPDVDVPVATFGTGRSEESDLRGDCESYDGGLQYVHKYHDHAMPLTAQASVLSSPSLADMHTLSTYYRPMGNNIYVPEQTHYHLNAPQETHSIEETVPAETLYHSTATQTTYCLEKNVKSRGTCPYIPDMTHNSYWDMRARVTKPRRSNPGNHNVLPKSSRCKQPVQVEAHYETDTNEKSRRSLELTNVDFHGLPTIHKSSPSESVNGTSRSKGEFPLLPTFRQTSASESQEAVKLTKSGRNSPSSELNFELSNKVFPTISKTRPSETQGYVDLSDQARSTSLPQVKIELTDEEFPLLPSICKTRPSESKGSVKLTGEAKNSAPSCLKSELLNEEFPPLPRTHITRASEGQESVQLTEHARNISSCQLNNACSKQESPLFPSILKAKSEGKTSYCSCEQARNSSSSQLNIDFGTYSKSKSLTEPKKDEKEDSAVSSYGGSDTMLVVPKVAMKCTESDENKSWIDSI